MFELPQRMGREHCPQFLVHVLLPTSTRGLSCRAAKTVWARLAVLAIKVLRNLRRKLKSSMIRAMSYPAYLSQYIQCSVGAALAAEAAADGQEGTAVLMKRET